jgi:hypothetical protein
MNRIVEWLLGTQQLAGQTEWGFKFLAEYNPYLKLLLILVLIGLVCLTIRSYRREGDAQPWVKVTLASLRLAVILVIMAILFRPAIVLKMVKTLHSVVVVLNDDSQSMSFMDRYADPDHQKHMTEYFKLTPAELATKSRLDLYREALLRKNGVLAVIAKDHPEKIFQFSNTQPGKEAYTRLMASVDQMRAEGDKTPFTGEPPAAMKAEYLKLKGDGYQTNLSEAVRDALEATQGQRLEALVVVTDGQPTNEDAENRLAASVDYARQRGVPVYTVMAGDPTPPKDVAVISIQGPREARKGSEVEFVVTIGQRNYDGKTVEVKLQRKKVGAKDWTDIDKKPLKLEGAENGSSGSKGLQTLMFKTKPEGNDTGLAADKKTTEWVYRAYVEPLPDEQNVNNNSAEALVRIVDSKINVLFISGAGGWEFQYLRNLLQRQNDLYRLSVWQQNAELEVSQAASSEDLRLSQMPSDLSDLMGDPTGKDPKRPGYQAIILLDPQRTRSDPKTGKGGFDEKFVDALELFVREHRGGLCYIAGNKYTDDNLLSSNMSFAKLHSMLPVELSINRQDIRTIMEDKPPEAWHVLLTEYGKDHQITRLDENYNTSLNIWPQLPGIYWSHSVAKIKPAARVLLENENPSRQTSRSEREPLLALHMYGSGPVIYVGTDDTWRWRSLEDAKYQKRFWNNIVGFLATLEASRVIITTGGDTFNVGERVKVEVEAYDDKYIPLKVKTITADVIDTQTPARNETLQLNKVEGKDGHYQGVYLASHRGVIEVTVKKLPDIDGVLKEVPGVEAKRFTVKLPDAESVRVEANEGVLKSMVTRDKGFLRLWEVDKLTELIPSGKLTSVQETPLELWDKQLPLWILVILLAVEWIFRKKFNMA